MPGTDRVVGAGLHQVTGQRVRPRDCYVVAPGSGGRPRPRRPPPEDPRQPAQQRPRAPALRRVRRGRQPILAGEVVHEAGKAVVPVVVARQAQQRRVNREVRVGAPVRPVNPIEVVVDVTCGVDHVAGDHHETRPVVAHGRAERRAHHVLGGVLLPGVADDHKAGDVGPFDDPQLRGGCGRYPVRPQLRDQAVGESVQRVVDRVDQRLGRDPGQAAPAGRFVLQVRACQVPVRASHDGYANTLYGENRSSRPAQV